MNHVYLSVSYIKDLDEVLALRKSLRACGDDTPHHVVVHDEDLPAFQAALAGDPQARLHSTADYLPARVERLRARVVAGRKPSKFVRSVMKRFGHRRTVEALQLTGWHYQQLTKLYATAAMPEECVVILDSDLLALAKPRADHFMRDGKCFLFETTGKDMASSFYRSWLESTKRFYGMPDETFADVNYVFGPVVWSRSMVRDLIPSVEGRIGSELIEAFSRHKLQSEYFLYGLFARRSGKFGELCVASSETLSLEIKEPVPESEFGHVIEALSDTTRRPFLWVHGFVPGRDALIDRILHALHGEAGR